MCYDHCLWSASIHFLSFHFHFNFTSGCSRRAKPEEWCNSFLRESWQLPNCALYKLKFISSSSGILISGHESAWFKRSIWSGCGFRRGQFFCHVWWPWSFYYLSPNHGSYAVGLGRRSTATPIGSTKFRRSIGLCLTSSRANSHITLFGTSSRITNKARCRRAHLRIRHSINASIKEVMNKACRESERDECRHPCGRAQLCRERPENPVAVVGAGLAICFYLKNRKEKQGEQYEQEHDRPWPHVQSMQKSAHNAGGRS